MASYLYSYLKQTLPKVRVGTIHHLFGVTKKTRNPNWCYFAFHTAWNLLNIRYNYFLENSPKHPGNEKQTTFILFSVLGSSQHFVHFKWVNGSNVTRICLLKLLANTGSVIVTLQEKKGGREITFHIPYHLVCKCVRYLRCHSHYCSLYYILRIALSTNKNTTNILRALATSFFRVRWQFFFF